MHLRIQQSAMVQVLGSLPPLWQIWTDFPVIAWGHFRSESISGILALSGVCVCQIKTITRSWPCRLNWHLLLMARMGQWHLMSEHRLENWLFCFNILVLGPIPPLWETQHGSLFAIVVIWYEPVDVRSYSGAQHNDSIG